MKKSAKLKKYGIAAAALPVGLAVMLTGFSFVNAPSYADTTTNKDLFANVVLADKCDYGDSFRVPVSGVTGVTPVVTAPNDQTVDLDGALSSDGKYYTVTAEQIGNYTVTYANGDDSYTHNVYVTLDEEYFLRVDDNGAGIPSYMAKSGEFTVPGAKVAYYDDNSMLKPYPGDIVLTVKDSANKEYKPGDKFKPDANGKTYITYSAQLGGESGRKFFSKTFEINVQNTFSDTQAPTLSVSGVASEISVNRAVKLPAATATDNYDENVKIEITVLGPDGEKVKLTDVDDYGYALVKDGVEYGAVDFDNDKAMTFYPTVPGTYKVSYVATDDSGNKSAVREYTMTAKDVAAPVFHSIADDKIPETWGLEIKDKDGVVTGKGGKVKFPIPELVDNVSRVGDEGNPISLYFRITDSDNSRTVVEFEDVLAGGEKATFSGKTYGKETDGKFPDLVWGEDGLDFDFSLYNRTDSSGDKTDDLTGTYTVYYRASDSAQNRSSKTYTIKLEDTYEDKALPSTAEVTAPSYLSVIADESFTVPTPAVADAKDSRPTVDYRLYSDNRLDGDALFINVKGGEKAEFETRTDGTYLVVDKDKTTKKELKVGKTLYYVVSVTDKVGNTKTNLATEGDYTSSETKTSIVGAVASETGAFNYKGNIAFSKKVNTPSADGENTSRNTATIEAGDTVVAGGFSIDVDDASMRKLTGFEVTVKNPNGDVVNTTLDTVSVDNVGSSGSKIYVSNITFKASVKGTYRLTVKVFDANGVSSAYGYSVEVAPSGNDNGIQAQSATIGSRANVNVKYQLHNDTIDIKDDDADPNNHYYVARRISGGSFSLIGSEFTAHTNGSYSVRDGYIAVEDITSGYDFADATPFGKGAYSFSAQDDSAPVIEVQGIMPTYADKGAEVKLPFVIASSPNGKADVEVVVKNEKSKEIQVDEITEENSEFEYVFKGTTDGKYTVTYTATYANATPVTATYSINIGDVVGPEFTIKGGTAASARMRVGDTFNFADMELSQSENNVTITKKLYNPSREEVTEATVSGSYDSHRNDKYNGYDSKDKESPIKFTMAGQYEVVYTATDSVGNVTTQRYNITVVSSGSGKPTTITTLSTVLIVVAVVLLAGVIVYVVRFRKVKVKNK